MALRKLDRVFSTALLKQALKATTVRAGSTSAVDHNDPYLRIGKREVVGYGCNGGLNYADRADFPMPAIRFREENNEIKALRQKEAGDWKKMTVEEKKALYRASFCQTFAEFNAPTGEWKIYLGTCVLSIGLALCIYMTLAAYVLPPAPASTYPENQQKQLKRMIDLEVNPITGLASKWDYEKGKWK